MNGINESEPSYEVKKITFHIIQTKVITTNSRIAQKLLKKP